MASPLSTLAEALLTTQAELQMIVLFVSVIQRLWEHIHFEGRTPYYLPEAIVSFLTFALQTTSTSMIQDLWRILHQDISSWKGPVLQVQMDDLFRQFGQASELDMRLPPVLEHVSHLLKGQKCCILRIDGVPRPNAIATNS